MNKAQFLGNLQAALGRLPQAEVEQSLAFYGEMIDDRIEDGMSEEDAVAQLGDVQVIANQIISETPLIPRTVAKAKTGSKTLNIVLLIVLSPVWVPIAISLAVAALSIYLALWAVIFSLWVTVAAMILSGFAFLLSLVYFFVTGFPLSGMLAAGIGLGCIGIGIFCYFGVFAASKGLFKLTQLFAHKIKSLFVREEAPHE
jgi:uncharacterized membrane protein